MPADTEIPGTATGGKTLFLAILLPLLGGWLFSDGLAPLDLAGAALLTHLPVLYAVRRLRPPLAACASLLYGVSGAVWVAWWVFEALHTHYHQGAVISLLFVVFVVGLGVGLFTGTPVLLWRVLAGSAANPRGIGLQPRAWILRPLLFAGLVFVFELLRTHGPLSMPWGLIGAGLGGSQLLVQSADIAGTLGHSFVCALAGGLALEAVEARLAAGTAWTAADWTRSRPLRALAALLVLLCGYGAVREIQVDGRIRAAAASGKPLRVAAIQANIPQGERWEASLVGRNMGRHIDMSREAAEKYSPGLIVWPETAMNTYLTGDDEYRSRIYGISLMHGVDFLLGGPHAVSDDNGNTRYFNSIFQLSPASGLGARYDKRQLLAFAEYNPFSKVPLFPRPKQVPLDYTPGTAPVLFDVRGVKIGAMICFEALYPWLSRDLVNSGATLLLNVSNDAWFGRTKAPGQHVEQARLRAIELRRYLVRNAGTGITVAFDPLGREIGAALPVFTEGVLAADIYPMDGRTVYARLGDWPLFILSFLMIAAGIRFRVRRPAT